MTTWSPEEIVDDAIVALGAGLPASIAAIYATYAAADAGAGRTLQPQLPRVGAIDGNPAGDYYPGGASELLRYPAIEVGLPDMTLSQFSLGQNDADAAETLIVVVWEWDAQFPKLYRRLLRLAAATLDVLLQPGALGGSTVRSVRLAWRFNPENGAAPEEIASGALIALSLDSTRARP